MTLPENFPALVTEWRESPVTRALQAALRLQLDRRRSALVAAYWSGRPAPESERAATLAMEAFWSDLFESSADDITATLENMTDDGQPERNQTA